MHVRWNCACFSMWHLMNWAKWTEMWNFEERGKRGAVEMLNEWLVLPHSCSFFIIWWLSITRGRVTLQFLWILYSNSFHTSRGEVFFSKAAETSLTSDFESGLCAACSLCFSLTMWNDRIYQNMDIFVPGCSGGKKKEHPTKNHTCKKLILYFKDFAV